MYEIPKELKTDIKLWAVYSSDIPFLLVMLIGTLMLEDFFTGGLFQLKMAYYLVNVVFAFLFITKPIPNVSIFKIITHGLLTDFRKVRSLDYQANQEQVTLESLRERRGADGPKEWEDRLGEYSFPLQESE